MLVRRKKQGLLVCTQEDARWTGVTCVIRSEPVQTRLRSAWNMAVDSQQQQPVENTGFRQRVPARYVLAALAFCGIMLQYTLKVNLSVAIVAMVKQPHLNLNITSVCSILNSSSYINKKDTENRRVDLDWDEVEQGHMLAAYYYGYIATQLLGGYLAQTIGGRLLVGPALLLAGIFTIMSPWAAEKGYSIFMTVRVMVGAASGVVIPALHGMFTHWFPPQERTRFSGAIFSAVNFGSLVGMALSGYLITVGSWQLVFFFFGGVSMGWSILWLLLAYDSPEKHPHISIKELQYIQKDLETSDKKFAVPWVKILTSVPIWAAIAMHFGQLWVMFTLLSELPTYLKNVLHFDIKESGVLASLPYLFAWVSGSLTGSLSQWLRKRGLLSHLMAYRIFNGITSIGAALCLVTITLVHCNSSIIVMLLVLTMVTNSCLYGGSYMNHADLAIHFTGTISGILHTVINTAGIITPIIAGLLTKDQLRKQLLF